MEKLAKEIEERLEDTEHRILAICKNYGVSYGYVQNEVFKLTGGVIKNLLVPNDITEIEAITLKYEYYKSVYDEVGRALDKINKKLYRFKFGGIN